MSYVEQVEEIGNYFKLHEKTREEFKLGVEFEYFVVNKFDFQAVDYYGNNGVCDTLKQLEKRGYEGIYENSNLLGLIKDRSTITLEPGSQLEISIKPYKNIVDIEIEFLAILRDINEILIKKNQCLIACGYSPNTPISKINMIPKNRYFLMENYFKKCGKYAHHMMKGSASLQLSLDYQNEIDYRKKYKVASALSPLFYAMFDNSPRFEGNWYNEFCVRSLIWNNCDDNRCGIIPSVFQDDFGYFRYAEYILDRSPLFIQDKIIDIPFKDVFNPKDYVIQDLEHVLSMFFPDVRTKRIIEIRMIDSLPYPFNFAAVAFFKGLFYDENNLNAMYDLCKQFSVNDIVKAKTDIISSGIHASIKDYSIIELMKWLYDLAIKGVNPQEKIYLKPLEDLIERKISMMSTINREDLTKAFEPLIVTHEVRGDYSDHYKRIY